MSVTWLKSYCIARHYNLLHWNIFNWIMRFLYSYIKLVPFPHFSSKVPNRKSIVVVTKCFLHLFEMNDSSNKHNPKNQNYHKNIPNNNFVGIRLCCVVMVSYPVIPIEIVLILCLAPTLCMFVNVFFSIIRFRQTFDWD